MNAQASNELYAIKQELVSIIAELEEISAGVKRDFQGIGSERCAASIDSVIDRYHTVKRKLDHLDTTTVTEEFSRAHGSFISGGGGSGSFGGGGGGGGRGFQ